MNAVVQIQPKLPETPCAYELAKVTCDHWGQCNFYEELERHYHTGFVAVLPHLFLMARPIELPDERRAWLITHAIGELPMLVATAPFHLEWVAFRRRFDKRLRVYRTARLMHLAFRLREKERK